MPSISAMVRGPRIFRIAARQVSAIAALRTSRGRAEAGQKSLARAVVADTMSTVVVEIDLRSAVEAVADTISTVVAEIDLTSAVEVVAEAISAAEVVDAAEGTRRRRTRRRRATFGHQSQAGHRSACAARQRSRTLSLPLQGRRSHDLCGRHGAGRAEARTERSLARTRRIFAGRL